MNGMTIKQIAKLCGVEERTVRRWVRLASDKMSGLSDKMSVAFQTKQPAIFTLEETIAIVRAGGNNTLADLLAQNAAQAPQPIGTDRGYSPRDVDMMMLGYRRGLLESGKLAPRASTPPTLKALPRPQRSPLAREDGILRLKTAEYPITLRRLARVLDVDPAIIRRFSDRLGYPLSGGEERAFTRADSTVIWDCICAGRTDTGRIEGGKE